MNGTTGSATSPASSGLAKRAIQLFGGGLIVPILLWFLAQGLVNDHARLNNIEEMLGWLCFATEFVAFVLAIASFRVRSSKVILVVQLVFGLGLFLMLTPRTVDSGPVSAQQAP